MFRWARAPIVAAAVSVVVLVLTACGGGDTTDATGADVDEASETEHDDEHDDHGEHDDEHDEHDDEDSSSGLGAHEHGVAELSVAWSDDHVLIDLISPTHNIFGFEHEASTDDDMAVVAERTEALSADGVMALNDEAGCALVDDVVTEVEHEGGHAELSASWLFACDNPDELEQLDVTALFVEFPNLLDIDAQWVSATGQSASELSPTATVLKLD